MLTLRRTVIIAPQKSFVHAVIGNFFVNSCKFPHFHDPNRRKREADCLPYDGDFQNKKVHDVIGNFPFTPWTDLICECYGLCRGIHAEDNRTVPLSPPPGLQRAKGPLVQRGLGSEADWGIVNGQAITDGRIIGAVGNPSDKNRLRRADFCHLPLHKGGMGRCKHG